MINHLVALTVPGATAERFYDFMIDPNTEKYHAWWPEEHLRLKSIAGQSGLNWQSILTVRQRNDTQRTD